MTSRVVIPMDSGFSRGGVAACMKWGPTLPRPLQTDTLPPPSILKSGTHQSGLNRSRLSEGSQPTRTSHGLATTRTKEVTTVTKNAGALVVDKTQGSSLPREVTITKRGGSVADRTSGDNLPREVIVTKRYVRTSPTMRLEDVCDCGVDSGVEDLEQEPWLNSTCLIHEDQSTNVDPQVIYRNMRPETEHQHASTDYLSSYHQEAHSSRPRTASAPLRRQSAWSDSLSSSQRHHAATSESRNVTRTPTQHVHAPYATAPNYSQNLRHNPRDGRYLMTTDRRHDVPDSSRYVPSDVPTYDRADPLYEIGNSVGYEMSDPRHNIYSNPRYETNRPRYDIKEARSNSIGRYNTKDPRFGVTDHGRYILTDPKYDIKDPRYMNPSSSGSHDYQPHTSHSNKRVTWGSSGRPLGTRGTQSLPPQRADAEGWSEFYPGHSHGQGSRVFAPRPPTPSGQTRARRVSGSGSDGGTRRIRGQGTGSGQGNVSVTLDCPKQTGVNVSVTVQRKG